MRQEVKGNVLELRKASSSFKSGFSLVLLRDTSTTLDIDFNPYDSRYRELLQQLRLFVRFPKLPTKALSRATDSTIWISWGPISITLVWQWANFFSRVGCILQLKDCFGIEGTKSRVIVLPLLFSLNLLTSLKLFQTHYAEIISLLSQALSGPARIRTKTEFKHWDISSQYGTKWQSVWPWNQNWVLIGYASAVLFAIQKAITIHKGSAITESRF